MRDGLSEFDVASTLILRSPHFESTLTAVREKMPEIESDVKKVLENVDSQGLKNVFLFKSEKIPDLVIPATKVNVNEILSATFGITSHESPRLPDDSNRIVYFNFRGFATSPSGHPFTSWNMVYDRAVRSFPKIANAMRLGEPVPQIDIYSLGSPIGTGGQVSEEFLELLKTKGFAAHGKAYAELVLEEIGPDTKNTQVTFNGNSLGCTVAEKTAQQFPADLKINMLMDNPVNAENYPQVIQYIRGAQQAIAYVSEVLFKDTFDKRSKLEKESTIKFNNAFSKILEDKLGAEPDDDKQKSLKRAEMLLEEWNLIKGNSMDNETRRIFIRRGYKDPLTVKIHDLLKGLQDSPTRIKSFGQDGKISTFAVDESHFMDRARTTQWKRAIEFVKNSGQI